jgi:hypothetical protein
VFSVLSMKRTAILRWIAEEYNVSLTGRWTRFQIDAEYDHYDSSRIVAEYNRLYDKLTQLQDAIADKEAAIAELRTQLAQITEEKAELAKSYQLRTSLLLKYEALYEALVDVGLCAIEHCKCDSGIPLKSLTTSAGTVWVCEKCSTHWFEPYAVPLSNVEQSSHKCVFCGSAEQHINSEGPDHCAIMNATHKIRM